MSFHPSDSTLWEILDGEQETAESSDLRTHITECPSCSDSLTEMRRLDDDVETYFQSRSSRSAATPQPLVNWREVDRRRRRFGSRRLSLAVASLAAAAAIAIALLLLFARGRAAHVDQVRGWLFAGAGTDLEAVSNADRFPGETRIVALSDTSAVLVVPTNGARFTIDGRADLDLTDGKVTLREGSIRGDSRAHIDVPALGVSAEGNDFRVAIDAEGCTVRAGTQKVRIVSRSAGGGFDQEVASGHCVKISPGSQPWFEKDSSNVCEELPTVSPFPTALRDADVGDGAASNPSERPRRAEELFADALHSTSIAVRRRVVEAIGLIPVESLGGEVLAIAGRASEAASVRAIAAESAIRAHAPGAVAVLSELIESPQTTLEVRVAAARALGRVGPSPAAEAALKSIGTRPTSARPAVDVNDLSSLYDALLSDLQSAADADKPVGLAVLARISSESSDLAAAVRAFEARFRIAAVRLALMAGDEDVATALANFLDDPDSAVAAEAVLALGLRHETSPRPSDESISAEILRATQKRPNDALFRARAVYALGLFADPATLPMMIASAESDDPRTRRHAVFGIGRVLVERADALESASGVAGRDALRKALVDPDDGVRAEAVSALQRALFASPHEAAIALVPRLDDSSERVRFGAALALLSVPSAEAAEPLRRRFESTEEKSALVRSACAQAYGACARAGGSATLRHALQFQPADPILMRGILLGLNVAFDGTGEDDIFALLESPETGVRVATIECLRSIRNKLSSRETTLRRIAPLLQDSMASVRLAAIGFLSSWRPNTTSEIETWILPALRDADPRVQLEAAVALICAGRPEGPDYVVKRLLDADPDAKLGEKRADQVRVLSALRGVAPPLPDAIARAAEELETRGSLDDEATVAALLQLALAVDRPASDALLGAAGRSSNPWIQVGAACALARGTQDRALIAKALDRVGRPRDLVRALADLPQRDRDDLRDDTVSDAAAQAIERAFTQWPADSVLHFEPSPGFLRSLADSSKRQLRIDQISRLVTLRTTVLASVAEIASDSRPNVRALGTRALGAFSSRPAQRLTVKRLEDTDIDVREAARVSLVESLGQDFGFSPLGDVAHMRPIIDDVRTRVLDRGAEFGDRAAELIERLRTTLAVDK